MLRRGRARRDDRRGSQVAASLVRWHLGEEAGGRGCRGSDMRVAFVSKRTGARRLTVRPVSPREAREE